MLYFKIIEYKSRFRIFYTSSKSSVLYVFASYFFLSFDVYIYIHIYDVYIYIYIYIYIYDVYILYIYIYIYIYIL